MTVEIADTKLAGFKRQTPFAQLPFPEQEFIENCHPALNLTFQEFRQVVAAALDLSQWGEDGVAKWWQEQNLKLEPVDRHVKKRILSDFFAHVERVRKSAKVYNADEGFKPAARARKPVTSRASDKKIMGMCPVASEKTVCCNLRTIDAVEQCVFGCSYCTVQTFYGEKIVFDPNFAEKLNKIELEPDRFYHIGTGQASDSLAFGNRDGILDTLCEFARSHPKILLEFKTKSNNIGYFLQNNIPKNCVCSWSLNTPAVIANEEHFTASLSKRLAAARAIADKGVKVSFHFHPMVYYQNWDVDYRQVGQTLLKSFSPDEVLFVSYGTLTFIKPVMQQIRRMGQKTKILQMEMAKDPHGKLTYPDEIKIAMFNEIYQTMAPWRGRVFQYLCMEKKEIWHNTLGYAYPTNEAFEHDFGAKTMSKL